MRWECARRWVRHASKVGVGAYVEDGRGVREEGGRVLLVPVSGSSWAWRLRKIGCQPAACVHGVMMCKLVEVRSSHSHLPMSLRYAAAAPWSAAAAESSTTHASGLVDLVNLARLGNKHVAGAYDMTKLRAAAADISGIVRRNAAAVASAAAAAAAAASAPVPAATGQQQHINAAVQASLPIGVQMSAVQVRGREGSQRGYCGNAVAARKALQGYRPWRDTRLVVRAQPPYARGVSWRCSRSLSTGVMLLPRCVHVCRCGIPLTVA